MFKKNKSVEEQPTEEVHQETVVSKRAHSQKERTFGIILFGLLILVVCLGLFGAGFGAFTLWKSQLAHKDAPSISGLSSVEVAQTQGAAPTEEEVSQEAKTTTAATAIADEDLKKAQGLDVIVMNGGGAKGVATEAADFLKKEGFTKTTVGNTKGDFAGTVVYFKKGQDKEAEAVKQKLATKYTSITAKEAVTSDAETATATITVIFGK